MKKDIIKEIIRDFHVAPLPSLVERDISIPFSSGKITTLVGARRSGKTCVLFNLMDKLVKAGIDFRNILYVNFEDERIDLKLNELDLILKAYAELYPDTKTRDCYLFFDEIQNIENWEKFIRRVYDSLTENIFITGSNSRFLSSDIATSLRGRTISFEVFPLSFREYLRFNRVGIDIYSSRSLAKINNYLLRFLKSGGFPEVFAYDDNMRAKVLQEYFNVMIYRDLIERYEIKNALVLKYFLKRILASATKQLSVNTIYNELKSSGVKIGKNHLYEYLDACQNIYLAFVLTKHTHKLVARELGERKIYAIDNGLLNAISFKFSEDKGKAVEQAVFLELKRRGSEVYFYREKYECDFIIKKGHAVLEAIQVASSVSDKKTAGREIRGLVDACKNFGLKEGTIITLDESKDFESDGIKINQVPLYKWLLE
ncbi:MAG: ATP-binding protein [Planctomycetes bacterium]|nr:ATP-binding protein [Planctomycetota bacterium]